MNMIARSARLTAEEFERMSGTEGLELVDGRIKEKQVGGVSSLVNCEFGRVLGNFVREHRLGHVFDSECTYQCFPTNQRTVRKPDVSFVRRGRFPGERIPQGHIRIPPDLAVEVVSPNDTWYEVEEKVSEYRSVQIPLIWVVNPDSRTIHVYRPDGTVSRLRESDELSGETVLPGFRVRVADLLPPSLPPADSEADA